MKLALVALVAAALLAGCGGQKLTIEENSSVASAEFHVSELVANGAYYGKTLGDIDRLIALYRAKPDAKYDGRTMRQVLQDAASDLEPYRPQLASKLDRATR